MNFDYAKSRNPFFQSSCSQSPVLLLGIRGPEMDQLIQLVFKSLKVYVLGLGIKGGNPIVLCACRCRVQSCDRVSTLGLEGFHLTATTTSDSSGILAGLYGSGWTKRTGVLRTYAGHKQK